MRKGFALLAAVLVIGGLIVIGSGIVTARFLLSKNSTQNQNVSTSNESEKSDSGQAPTRTGRQSAENPSFASEEATSTASDSEEILKTVTAYTQPQNLYSITMPSGWVVNSTVATGSYSTTKFTGSEGNISISFGDGKDPIGGCSETSSIVLSDRIIPGCFLLQKDGSKLLTRAYTKTKGGLKITIEAYINSPNALNSPVILDAVKTIDIN